MYTVFQSITVLLINVKFRTFAHIYLNLNPSGLHYYQYMASLDRCNEHKMKDVMEIEYVF